MSDAIEQLEILYEIAMSIGASTDLRPMLRSSLATLLRKLNCSAGGVLFWQPEPILSRPEGDRQDLRFEPVFTIPRSTASNRAYQAALRHAPVLTDAHQLAEFHRQLPISGQGDGDSFFHILGLPEVGLLILTRSGEGLDTRVLKSLQPLMRKLAGACKACAQNAALREGETRYRALFEEAQQEIAERKRVEEKLRESESLYHSLVEALPINLCRKDPEGRFTFGNRRFCASLQRPLAEIVGKTDFDIHPAELAQKYRQDDQRVVETGQVFEAIEEHALLGGEKIYVQVIKSPLYDVEGKVAGVQIIFWDVTEHKRAEEALQRSEERLRTLINAMPDIVIFKDGEGRYLEANDFDLRFFQLEKVDYRGKTDAELAEFTLFYRDALRACLESDQIAWQARRLCRGDEVVPRPDDSPRIFDVIKLPTFYPDGRRKGLIVVGRDVTERKQAEEALQRAHAELERRVAERTAELERANARLVEEIEERQRVEDALRESETRYRSLFEDTPLPLWEEDFSAVRAYLQNLHASGIANWRACFDHRPEAVNECARLIKVLDVNKAAVTLVGAQDKQDLLAGLPDGFTDNSLKAFVEELVTLAEGGQHFESEAVYRKLTGEEQSVILHLSVAPGYESSLGRVLVSMLDTTDRRRAEKEREALIAELEAKNAELERFTYTVSHDLKSPLITIQGFLGFVEQAAVAGNIEQLKADIARISSAADKMQQLLGDLLELSRIGRLRNAPEEAPLGDLAREAVSMVAGRLTRRGVEVDIAPDLPVVCGDRTQLREMLENLLDNAVKYMGDQPHPRVEIGVRHDGDEAVFYVCDNGIGIEPRYHHKVFGLFEKLDPKAEGTGVGLALVKRIVEVHGGRIWVESEGAGRGSTFCFTLPGHK